MIKLTDKNIDWILKNIRDKDSFIKGLLRAIKKAEKTRNFDPIGEYLQTWEAVAEINSIPEVRKKIMENFTAKKKGTFKGISSGKLKAKLAIVK